MASPKLQDGIHLKRTSRRPANREDQATAAEILQQVRTALRKYRDYRVAQQDGYHEVPAGSDQSLVHFASSRYGLIGSLWFRPAKPTSLLYRKMNDRYELVGALYVASQFATEAELNRRVPLSVARWRAHVNICLPPQPPLENADGGRFGFSGSIATAVECAAAGGTFLPQIFGWMIRIFPFEKSPERIWDY